MINFTAARFGTPLCERIVALRDEALRKPLGLEFSAEDLAAEREQRHFALVDSDEAAGEVVACLLAAPLGGGRFKLRQMAVAEGRRGEGLGRRLVEEVEAVLCGGGATELTLHARDVAVGFYEKLGYQTRGEPFVEIGIPHQEMGKRL